MLGKPVIIFVPGSVKNANGCQLENITTCSLDHLAQALKTSLDDRLTLMEVVAKMEVDQRTAATSNKPTDQLVVEKLRAGAKAFNLRNTAPSFGFTFKLDSSSKLPGELATYLQRLGGIHRSESDPMWSDVYLTMVEMKTPYEYSDHTITISEKGSPSEATRIIIERTAKWTDARVLALAWEIVLQLQILGPFQKNA
jgi:hypothetical protein